MQSNKAGITALYCRLSRDDGNKESDSNSIENQKIMLSRYAQEKGFENTRFYVDDGFTWRFGNKTKPCFDTNFQADERLYH